jgi:hypothetical protein
MATSHSDGLRGSRVLILEVPFAHGVSHEYESLLMFEATFILEKSAVHETLIRSSARPRVLAVGVRTLKGTPV